MKRFTGFSKFLKSNRHERRIFVFDLDKTLWDYTVEECSHISVKEAANNYIHNNVPELLSAIQSDEHSINIASRSKKREKCLELLELAFPTILFDKKEIFYTPKWKREHFSNIIQEDYKNKFFYFDDELHIQHDISAIYDNCVYYNTKYGFNPHVFT